MRNQLTEAFGAAGTVVSIRLPTDRESGELKGIGFVEFEDTTAKVRREGRRQRRSSTGGLGAALRRAASLPPALHACTPRARGRPHACR